MILPKRLQLYYFLDKNNIIHSAIWNYTLEDIHRAKNNNVYININDIPKNL